MVLDASPAAGGSFRLDSEQDERLLEFARVWRGQSAEILHQHDVRRTLIAAGVEHPGEIR